MTDIPPTFRLSEPEDFDIDVTDDDAGITVAVRGELDVLTAPFLWERLETLLPESGERLVLDLGGVRFIDSMGLGVIVRAQSRLSNAAGQLVVRAPQEQARKVFEMTGLDRTLDLEG
ncbi:MAG TPA: STAS domain-containing protein [Acidimicrobiia bacterium]